MLREKPGTIFILIRPSPECAWNNNKRLMLRGKFQRGVITSPYNSGFAIGYIIGEVFIIITTHNRYFSTAFYPCFFLKRSEHLIRTIIGKYDLPRLIRKEALLTRFYSLIKE